MIELDDGFGLQNLSNVSKAVFDPLYNTNRVSSWEGHMCITSDKVYYLVTPTSMAGKTLVDAGGPPKSWCIDISEIASYGKYGLGGFKIALKDGTVLRFTNVFRKMRNGITAALQESMG